MVVCDDGVWHDCDRDNDSIEDDDCAHDVVVGTWIWMLLRSRMLMRVMMIMLMLTSVTMKKNNYMTMVTIKAIRMLMFVIMTVMFIMVVTLVTAMATHLFVFLLNVYRRPTGFIGVTLFRFHV